MALEQLLPERIVRRKPTMTVNAKYKAFLNSTVVEEMLPKDIQGLCAFYDPDTGQLVIEPVEKLGTGDAWPIRRFGKGITLSLAVLARKHGRNDIAEQRFPVVKQNDDCLAVDLNAGTSYTRLVQLAIERGKE